MRRILFVLAIALLVASCSREGETPQPSVTFPPSTGAPQPSTTSPPDTKAVPPSSTSLPSTNPPPTPSAEPDIKGVFVISWDSGRADKVYALMDQGALPHFKALADRGLRAKYARSVDPTLSAAAQNSISTGCYPAKTGLVSNSYHNPNDSFYWYRRGLDEPLDQAEPVWVTASRAGFKTAALFFMGGSPELPTQMADYTIGYGIRDAYSSQQVIDLAPVEEPWDGEPPTSFSPPYEGFYTIREVARVHLYVLDRSDDKIANYDTVVINTQRAVNEAATHLGVGDWGKLLLNSQTYAGADFLVQEIEINSDLGNVTLFQGNVFRNTAAPRLLLEELNQRFGFFPSGADYYALEKGWITPEENLYLLKRASLWMASVAAWVQEEYQPDLLFTWQDGFDAIGHAFLMEDPRQMDYSPENAESYAGYYLRGAQIADQALEVMLGAIDLENTTVLMVSDHGIAPIHSVVYVNTILEQAGLLTLDSRDYVVVERTQAFAVAAGGAAHIYINLEGHEMDGTVSPEEYPLIQEQVYQLFANLIDPTSGEVVFQRVLRGNELAEAHLDHLNSGDVFVQAAPGYHLDGWRGVDTVFEIADFYGQHGYDSSLPEMRAMFIAAGAQIPTSGEVIPEVRIVDYAPTIAALLGFDPARNVDGNPIPALVMGDR